MRRRRLAPLLGPVALLAAAMPVAAEGPHAWLSSRIAMPVRAVDAGAWHPVGGEVFATDPLTLWQTGPEAETIPVPDAPARILGYLEPEEGRTALMALVWSDADVVCGHDLTNIGVDTGLAGFMTPADVTALLAYGAAYGGDLYNGPYAEQLDAAIPTIPFIATLPDGARFPVTGSGWGDGGYPVASLHAADGSMVALYTQFITAEGKDWLLPPPCDATTG